MKKVNLKIFSLIIVFGLLLTPKISDGAVSDPQLIITWKTDSFIPHWYKGKAMPIRGSSVRASLAMTDNGKFVDLSKYEIRWDGNNGVFEKGMGFVNFTFNLGELISGPQDLSATVVGYNGQNVKKTISIPISKPEVGLETNLTKLIIQNGGKATLKVLPFFFNINNESDLEVRWTVNGKTLANESGDRLVELNIPKYENKGFLIDLFVKNRMEELEFASENKFFDLLK